MDNIFLSGHYNETHRFEQTISIRRKQYSKRVEGQYAARRSQRLVQLKV